MHIYLILALQFFNHTCFRGSKVLLALFALELGASTLTIGLLFAMYSLLPTFLSVYAGRIADRIGYRTPMILGTFGLMLGMLIPFFVPTIVGLFLSATLAGSCYIFYTVSVQNLVGLLGAGSERTRNYSWYALVVGATALFGPVFAGFSLEHLGGSQTYLLMALVPLLPLLILVFGFGSKSTVRQASTSGPKRRAMDLLRNPPLRRMLMTAGIVETVNELGNFLLPIYGDSVGLSPSQIGIMMGALAAALFLVRALLPALVRRYDEPSVLAGSMVLAAGACLVFPFAESFVMLLGAAFFLGLGVGCGAPLSMSLVFNRAPEGRSGEAMGLRQTVNKGTEVVIPVVFGSVSATLGMIPVFWLVAVLLGAGVWLLRVDARKGAD
jgi:MFS family permease